MWAGLRLVSFIHSAFCTGWGALTGVGLAELRQFWRMRASNESAKKAANGTHLAIRIGNLQFDEGSDEMSCLNLTFPFSLALLNEMRTMAGGPRAVGSFSAASAS